MMPPYHLANLSPGQLAAIEHVEQDLNLILIAYHQEPENAADPAFHEVHDSILHALSDTYRSDGLSPYPDPLGP